MQFSLRDLWTRYSTMLLGVAGLGLVFGVWCLLTYGGFVSRIFLPTPAGLWGGLLDYERKGWLWPSIGRSFLRVSKALGLVILIGVPLGLLMAAFKPVDALLQKLVHGAKSIPTTAISGVVILWFGIDETGKIFFLFLGSIFFMIVLVRNGVAGVPEDYVRVALDLGASRWQMIGQVLLPGALPRIWEAIVVCNGIMWTYIVLAEFIGSTEKQLGLGYLLFIGSRTQESGQVFATILVIAVLSSSTDYVLQRLRRRFLDW